MPDSIQTVWKVVGGSLVAGLLALNASFLNGLKFDVKKLDEKIFTHLTNHDIHIPREYIISKSEYLMAEQFHEKERAELTSELKDIKSLLNNLQDKKFFR